MSMNTLTVDEAHGGLCSLRGAHYVMDPKAPVRACAYCGPLPPATQEELLAEMGVRGLEEMAYDVDKDILQQMQNIEAQQSLGPSCDTYAATKDYVDTALKQGALVKPGVEVHELPLPPASYTQADIESIITAQSAQAMAEAVDQHFVAQLTGQTARLKKLKAKWTVELAADENAIVKVEKIGPVITGIPAIEAEELAYFQSKMFSALKLPLSYLEPSYVYTPYSPYVKADVEATLLMVKENMERKAKQEQWALMFPETLWPGDK